MKCLNIFVLQECIVNDKAIALNSRVQKKYIYIYIYAYTCIFTTCLLNIKFRKSRNNIRGMEKKSKESL